MMSKALNLQWVERVTLKDLMPNAKAVAKLFLKKVSIQEPAFKDTILLYRRSAESKQAEGEDEKKPVRAGNQVRQLPHTRCYFKGLSRPNKGKTAKQLGRVK